MMKMAMCGGGQQHKFFDAPVRETASSLNDLLNSTEFDRKTTAQALQQASVEKPATAGKENKHSKYC